MSEPVFRPHVFRVPHQEMFTWRTPMEWLGDVLDTFAVKDATVVADSLSREMNWDLLVVGSDRALSLVCLLLNQHAAQHPGDPTPPREAERLEETLCQPPLEGRWCFVAAPSLDGSGNFAPVVAIEGHSNRRPLVKSSYPFSWGETFAEVQADCASANAAMGLSPSDCESIAASLGS